MMTPAVHFTIARIAQRGVSHDGKVHEGHIRERDSAIL